MESTRKMDAIQEAVYRTRDTGQRWYVWERSGELYVTPHDQPPRGGCVLVGNTKSKTEHATTVYFIFEGHDENDRKAGV